MGMFLSIGDTFPPPSTEPRTTASAHGPTDKQSRMNSPRMTFDQRWTRPGNAALQIGSGCRASGNVLE